MRIAMPPVLFASLCYPTYTFFTLLLPLHLVHALFSGGITGFILYDMMHCKRFLTLTMIDYIHHGRPFGHYLRTMKTHHLDHHYKNPNLGFGVSFKFWDGVFGTDFK
jgi:sterol desaturase/sphingolipid hydroxylase (fatty acid hydroxylase superfamily)